jgi:hypothetical protein
LLEKDGFHVEGSKAVHQKNRRIGRDQQHGRQRGVCRLDLDRQQPRPGLIAVALHASGE